MKNIFSNISNFRLLKKQKVFLAFSSFSKKEWIIILSLALIFVVSFLFILNSLNKLVSVENAVSGGTIKEGIIGTPRFINPVLAFSDVDKDLVALIYSGLMRKDKHGVLIPDLAQKYEMSEDGLSYTFTLKDNIYFHDGEAVTVEDIIFTITQANNPLLRTSTTANWSGINIEKIDDKTIKFSMLSKDASFLENTTMGIMPKHLWGDFPIELSPLNTSPVGSGPFKISSTKKEAGGIVTSYELEAFSKFALGKPYIKKIVLNFYLNENELLNALKSNKVEQVSQISPENAYALREDYRVESYILPRIFGIFFNQNENQIFIDKNIIKAIDTAIDKERIVEEVLYGYGVVIDSPIPQNLLTNKEEKVKLTKEERLNKAIEILAKSGWKKNEEGLMEKSTTENKKTTSTPLSFSISTSNSPDLTKVANIIKENLESIGMRVDVKTFELGDLNQSVIRTRKYDSLLFGEIINRESDLFAFWHSSQRKDPGLNVALYTNVKVDKILEEALVTINDEKRAEKYAQFMEEIKKDSPAVFIYSPHFIYVVNDDLKGLTEKSILSAKDRFLNSYLWYKEVENVWKIFSNTNNNQ